MVLVWTLHWDQFVLADRTRGFCPSASSLPGSQEYTDPSTALRSCFLFFWRLAEGITYLLWPRNASGFPRRSCKVSQERGMSGISYSAWDKQLKKGRIDMFCTLLQLAFPSCSLIFDIVSWLHLCALLQRLAFAECQRSIVPQTLSNRSLPPSAPSFRPPMPSYLNR